MILAQMGFKPIVLERSAWVSCRYPMILFTLVGKANEGTGNGPPTSTCSSKVLHLFYESKTSDSVRSVRPGFGLAPKKLEWVLGQKLNKPVSANSPVKEDSFT